MKPIEIISKYVIDQIGIIILEYTLFSGILIHTERSSEYEISIIDNNKIKINVAVSKQNHIIFSRSIEPIKILDANLPNFPIIKTYDLEKLGLFANKDYERFEPWHIKKILSLENSIIIHGKIQNCGELYINFITILNNKYIKTIYDQYLDANLRIFTNTFDEKYIVSVYNRGKIYFYDSITLKIIYTIKYEEFVCNIYFSNKYMLILLDNNQLDIYEFAVDDVCVLINSIKINVKIYHHHHIYFISEVEIIMLDNLGIINIYHILNSSIKHVLTDNNLIKNICVIKEQKIKIIVNYSNYMKIYTYNPLLKTHANEKFILIEGDYRKNIMSLSNEQIIACGEGKTKIINMKTKKNINIENNLNIKYGHYPDFLLLPNGMVIIQGDKYYRNIFDVWM
jgi:hypothetical protein